MPNKHRKPAWLLLPILVVTPMLTGCGTIWQTLPERSATEQLLISTAADRAITKLPAAAVQDRNVFLQTDNLECYDKAYVIEQFRREIIAKKGVLAPDLESADTVLAVAAGTLSIDKFHHMFGIPEIGLPVITDSLKLPEAALYKREVHKGKAKFILTATAAATGKETVPLPVLYGRSRMTDWWILLFGPIRTSDIPEELQE